MIRLKKYLLWVILLVSVVGCQSSPRYEDTMDTFLKTYYETSQEEVDAYLDFEMNTSYEDKQTEAYIQQRNDLSLFEMLDVCTEKYMLDVFINMRIASNIPKTLEEQQVIAVKLGPTTYEKDYGDKDFQYYLHQTEIELSYQDGHTEKRTVKGRIGIDLKEKKVDDYRIDEALFNKKVI